MSNSKISALVQTAKIIFTIVLPIRKLYRQIRKISAKRGYGWSDSECYNLATNVFCNDSQISFLIIDRGNMRVLMTEFLIDENL